MELSGGDVCTCTHIPLLDAFAAVDRDDVDLAVAHDYRHDPRPNHATLDRVALFDEPLAIFARATTPSTATLSDFLACLVAAPFDSNACGRAVRAAWRAAGFEPRVVHSSNDFNALLTHVAAGTAIALLSRSALGRHDVAIIAIDNELERRVFTLTRRARRDHPAIVAVRRQSAFDALRP